MASHGVIRDTTTRVFNTANRTFTSTTPADVAGLSVPLQAGRRYRVVAVGICTSSDAAIGARIGFTMPALTAGAIMPQIGGSADGANTYFHGNISVSGDSVTSGTAEAGDMPFNLIGLIIPSANGNLVLQAGVETGTTATVTIKAGTYLEVTDLGA